MSDNFNNHERRTTESVRNSKPTTNGILGVAFGIFMVIVYIGMGVLLFDNYFSWTGNWEWTRWVVGAVLIVYGIYRGYRTYMAFKSHDE